MIDSHVHTRDFKEAKKETIEHAIWVAYRAGFDGIYAEPNTKPSITIREIVVEVMSIANKVIRQIEQKGGKFFYGQFVGLTTEPDQVKRAVDIVREFFPINGDERVGIVGLKEYAGQSTNDLTVGKIDQQRRNKQILVKKGYEYVQKEHCERDDLMRAELWDPSNPITHSLVRNKETEIQSVRDQIDLCLETGYALVGSSGRLHLVHLTTPEAIDLVQDYRDKLNITCAVRPLDLLLNNTVMNQEDGMMYKVNPPLRDEGTRRKNFGRYKAGMVDILESDHAPHNFKDKTERYASGIPILARWQRLISELIARGVSSELINETMHYKVNKIFGTKIPQSGRPLKTVQEDVGWYASDPTKYLSVVE